MTCFRPQPGLAHPHLQTLAGAALRPCPPLKPRREWFQAPDGERLGLDFLDAPGQVPTVLVLHGLSGTSSSPIVRGAMAAAHRLPARVVGMNFRGALGPPGQPRLYHAGRSDDLDLVVDHLLERFGPRLGVVGFSLGGNILLKWLGEKGQQAPPGVVGCAACVPYNLGNCARQLEKDAISRFYRYYMVRRLKARVASLLERFPGALEWKRVAAARTLTDFDREVTAPLNGFRDEEDYWGHCSSLFYLSRIARRAHLINAADDPFLAPGDLPHALVAANTNLSLEVTEQGGHLGYIGPGWRPWIERRIADFLRSCL